MSPVARLSIMCVGIVGTALLGGSLVLLSSWGRARVKSFIALGAGAMLGAAFLHMLPESAARAGRLYGPMVLAGFLMLFLVERFVLAHPCEEDHCDYHGMGMAAFFGMSLHNLVEGMSLGAGVQQAGDVGVAVFLAILLHKLPNAMSLASLLLAAGYASRRIFVLLLGFACMVPLGAAATFGALSSAQTERLTGLAMAAAAGTFLHVAASDLLPELHRAESGRFAHLAAFGLGLALMGAGLLVPH